MSDSAPGSPRTPLILTSITAALCLCLLLYIYSISESSFKRYVPWVDASMEIKYEISLAHLWFEEFLSGDTQETLESVEHHIQRANWFTLAILDGANNEQGIFLPLEEPLLRKQTNQLLYHLGLFKQKMGFRLTVSPNTAGTPIDQEFDLLFRQLLQLTNTLEADLKQHIKDEKQAKNSLMLMLMLAICTMTAIASYSIWRFTQNRANYLRQLSTANQRISEQNAQLKELAHTDQLTGLPNRKMLEAMATQILGHVSRNQTCLSVTFIDLDFFKPINDQYGHRVGDKVLTSLTKAICMELREGDILARLAGDEFILLLEEDSDETIKQALNQIFARIQTRLEMPIVIHPEEIHIRISAGTALAPTHAEEFDDLLHYADLAMYHSKQQGRGRHHYYIPEIIEKQSAQIQNSSIPALEPEQEAATE